MVAGRVALGRHTLAGEKGVSGSCEADEGVVEQHLPAHLRCEGVDHADFQIDNTITQRPCVLLRFGSKP